MSIPEGKDRRSITMPDEVWAILEVQMAESRQSLSQVMTQYFMTRPAALSLSLEGIKLQLTEQANAIHELAAHVQRLTELMDKRSWWHRTG